MDMGVLEYAPSVKGVPGTAFNARWGPSLLSPDSIWWLALSDAGAD